MRLAPAELEWSWRDALSVICMIMALAIAIADHRLGVEVSLVGVYVLPVGLAAWYGGLKAGYLTAAVAGIGLLAVDQLGGTLYSHAFFAYWDSLINGTTLMVVAALTATLRRQLRYERRVAGIDSLTRALTRRGFKEAIAHEALRLHRFGDAFSLIYFDLDDLKAVNDAYGHRSGNHMLQSFAVHIQHRSRRVDRLGRLGGDEFALLLPKTGRNPAAGVLQRLYNDAMGHSSRVRFSAGLVTFERIADELALEVADDAMYTAKRNGKGRGVSCVWKGKAYEISTWIFPQSRSAEGGHISPVEERMLSLSRHSR